MFIVFHVVLMFGLVLSGLGVVRGVATVHRISVTSATFVGVYAYKNRPIRFFQNLRSDSALFRLTTISCQNFKLNYASEEEEEGEGRKEKEEGW